MGPLLSKADPELFLLRIGFSIKKKCRKHLQCDLPFWSSQQVSELYSGGVLYTFIYIYMYVCVSLYTYNEIK